MPALLTITILSALAVLMPSQPTQSPPDQSLRQPSPQSVLDWALKAHGGREAHDRVTSRKSRGTYTQSDDSFEADVYLFEKRPALRRREILLTNGELVVEVVTADAAWTENNGTTRRASPLRETQVRRDAVFDLLTDWNTFYDKAEIAPPETIDGHLAHHVRLIVGDGHTLDLFFDTQTHRLIAQRERVAIDAERDYLRTVAFSDFRLFDGLLYPTTVKMTLGEGENARTISYRWSRIEHNTRLPRNAFREPPGLAQPTP